MSGSASVVDVLRSDLENRARERLAEARKRRPCRQHVRPAVIRTCHQLRPRRRDQATAASFSTGSVSVTVVSRPT